MSTKYLLSGIAVDVLHQVNGGHLVRDIYETDGGEESGAPRFTDEKLFDNPPVEKLEARVAELNGIIDALSYQRGELSRELADAKSQHEKLMAKFKTVPALEFLQEYIDGKITHLVMDYGYGVPEIFDFKSGIKCPDDYKDKLKLLCLYGDSKGDLCWRLSQYYDGSGMKRTVYPCTTLEQATAEARKIIERASIETEHQPRDYVIEGAKKFGAILPAGYERKFLESCIKGNTESITKEQSGLDERKGKLQQLQNRLAELRPE